MEAYLREKKEAILKDRKIEQESLANGGTIEAVQEEDQKSCLQ